MKYKLLLCMVAAISSLAACERDRVVIIGTPPNATQQKSEVTEHQLTLSAPCLPTDVSPYLSGRIKVA
ncbi:MAG TPA: hypothetical protein VFR09_05130, partial [Alphaproteobacteria bacterium]|nr:hypothetical protein [Alphaproteobacteria bacterium]